MEFNNMSIADKLTLIKKTFGQRVDYKTLGWVDTLFDGMIFKYAKNIKTETDVEFCTITIIDKNGNIVTHTSNSNDDYAYRQDAKMNVLVKLILANQ